MNLSTMLRIITLALTFLIRLRFPPRLGFVQVLTNRYGPEALSLYRNLEKLDLKLKKTDLDLNFLLTCKRHSVIPKFLYFKTYNHNIRSTDFYKAFQFNLKKISTLFVQILWHRSQSFQMVPKMRKI